MDGANWRGILTDLRITAVGPEPSRLLRRGGGPAAGPTPSRTARRLVRVWRLLSWLIGYGLFLMSVDGLSRSSLPVWARIILAVAMAAPVVLLADRPLLAWRLAWLTAALSAEIRPVDVGLPWPLHPVQLIVLPTALLVVSLRTRTTVTVWSATLTAALAVGFTREANLIPTLLLIFTLGFVGDQIRRRRQAVGQLRAAGERTELEMARRAVLEERTRIAREMHDAVAHHMSMIAVRAETAPYRLGELPAEASAEFASIAEGARESLTEMRRLLRVLRSENPTVEHAPQPGLPDLTDLILAVRASGVDVRSEITVDGPVPPGVGLCAYRIVQEALSNASRHAVGAAVTVTIRLETDAVVIDVVNRPGNPAETTVEGDRHGLLGMRERAETLGGTLDASATDEGGFRVHARLPLEV